MIRSNKLLVFLVPVLFKAILKTRGERLKTASCLKEAKNKFDVQKIHYDKW